jgi:protein-S-isoprenylcysteine O-methyltransferase Ste14
MTDTEPQQSDSTQADAPDVLTFPPVIFLIFYVIGYVTDRAFPTDFGTELMRYVAASLLLAFSGALVIWAITRFHKAKTHVDVRKPAIALVTDGPYRLSRNPMYVAMTLFYAGFAIVFSLPITLGLLIPCLALLYSGVISREETYLEGKFGKEYLDYKANVRRWL